MNDISRNSDIVPSKAALLVIDVQDFCCRQNQSDHTQSSGQPIKYFFDRLETTLFPNLAQLLKAARASGCEVIYTVIESLTQDGRDNSLDYKLSNLVVPKGDPGARVCEEVGPVGDEMVLPKSSCSVFNSTMIEYILRNLGIQQLMICGVMTNQCIESAVRDAADKGFLVTTVEDACACKSAAEHAAALHNLKGFSRIATSIELIEELASYAVQHEPKTNGIKRAAQADALANSKRACFNELQTHACRFATTDEIERFAGKTLNIAMLRPEDDDFYGQFIVAMFNELLGEAANELGFTVQLDDYLIKENLTNYPDDYSKYHGILIPGSLNSAYDDLPWIHRLKEEIRLLRRFRKPMVGVCFGHQVLAEALGGKVQRNPLGTQIASQSFCPTPEARNMFKLDESQRELKFLHHNNDIVVKLPEVDNCFTWKEMQTTEPHFFSSLYSGQSHILSIQGHPEFITPTGRTCLTEIFQGIDMKRGTLPNHIKTKPDLHKWMQEEVYVEENLQDSRRFAKLILKMLVSNSCHSLSA
mmetsp:Transcript_27209/g.35674  ORF Transcript_27209/g.35674 Transcript_27209/m.35674 type:complete len:530 (-) Transcript_27209:175-1764(-)